MSARIWQREPGLQPRYSLTLHTMRVSIARAPTDRGEWHVTCREVAIDYSMIPRSAEMSVETVQAAALATVRERIGEMAEEMAGVDP